jgi:hypothetical protein
VLDGVTPFPAEFAARYRALGYWEDRPLGLRPLDRVVVRLPNTAVFAVFYLALQRIGAIPDPERRAAAAAYPSLPYERILREWDDLGYDQSVMDLVFHANAERVLGL